MNRLDPEQVETGANALDENATADQVAMSRIELEAPATAAVRRQHGTVALDQQKAFEAMAGSLRHRSRLGPARPT